MIEQLTELTNLSIVVRLVLAAFMGGVIGIERGRKGRPAGFRTHMLVCLGAALVMLTNQYIAERYGLADPARLGAQVISGIGFLGAGTIIVTRHNQVIGLTTAAGLWASACMGLAIGVGFYMGAIMAFVFILLVVFILHRLDHFMLARSRQLDIYIEFRAPSDLSQLLMLLKENGMRVSDLDFLRSRDPEQKSLAAQLSIRLPCAREHTDTLRILEASPGIVHVEEL